MPPRPPPRCQLYDNPQRRVLRTLSNRWLRRTFSSTPATSESAEASLDRSATAVTTPYVKDGLQTWRVREDGKRKLPLPPILDPIALSQRNRWTEPKKPASAPADRTPFQKKLYNNAFAHMLSKPIREDRRLGVALPSSFLVPFRPLKHPTDGDIRLLPGSALKPTKAAGSFNAWALARQAHLRALGNKKRGAWRGLMAHEQGEVMGQGNARLRNDGAWRADMDELVLRLLRANVIEQLRYGFSKPRGGGVLARLWEDPRKPFAPYDGGESARLERQESTRRSLPDQLSLHNPPGALLLLRSLTPLSVQPLEAAARLVIECDHIVERLVMHKTFILSKFYPKFKPGPHSRWAFAGDVHPHLAPHTRIGKMRPAVARWTPQRPDASLESEAPSTPQEPGSSEAVDFKPPHARLIPVYSLPDLLGGDGAVSALLGGEQGDRLWGRDAVLLKAGTGPGAIGAITALERLRNYVEVPR